MQSIENWYLSLEQASKERKLVSNCIWYNKDIKLGGKSIYNGRLFSIGMWVISDLYKGPDLLPFSEWKKRGARESDRLMFYGIKSQVEKFKELSDVWNSKSMMCTNIENEFGEGRFFVKSIKKLLSLNRYKDLNEEDLKYKVKYHTIHGVLSDNDWKKIFVLPRTLLVSNKIRDIQYKILLRIIPCRHLLYKMKMVNSPICTFCFLEQQTIEHMFFHCMVVKNLWLSICRLWTDKTGLQVVPTLKICTFGIYERREVLDYSENNLLALNTIILLTKAYLVECHNKSKTVSLISCKNYLRYHCEILSNVNASGIDMIDIVKATID
jgi:hypothetical protein